MLVLPESSPIHRGALIAKPTSKRRLKKSAGQREGKATLRLCLKDRQRQKAPWLTSAAASLRGAPYGFEPRLATVRVVRAIRLRKPSPVTRVSRSYAEEGHFPSRRQAVTSLRTTLKR